MEGGGSFHENIGSLTSSTDAEGEFQEEEKKNVDLNFASPLFFPPVSLSLSRLFSYVYTCI